MGLCYYKVRQGEALAEGREHMKLGNRIKELRTEMGWSQVTLAERAYVSRQTISNWETEKSYPDVQSLLILSDIFGVFQNLVTDGPLVQNLILIRHGHGHLGGALHLKASLVQREVARRKP